MGWLIHAANLCTASMSVLSAIVESIADSLSENGLAQMSFGCQGCHVKNVDRANFNTCVES
jgi:hypothetical protein